MQRSAEPMRGFFPFALAAFLIGLVGGFSAVLGPAFVQDIGIAYSNTTWTALSQAIATAAGAPILGKLGDRLGRRRALLLGLLVYTLGSALSALAGSLAFMLAARFVVGLGTAAVTPTILACIVAKFPRAQLARGFSLYMLISSAAVIAGPTLGGLLIDACGWRVMLWVCTAISLAVVAVCAATAERDTPPLRTSARFDGAGAALVFLFFGFLLCLPSFGQSFGWRSVAFRLALLGAAVSLPALLAVERRAAQPILPPAFLKRKSLILSVLALFLTQALMQANMTNTIVFMNYAQPSSGTLSAYAISVLYLGMSLGAVLIGPLADRYPAKAVLLGSLLVTAAGCALLLFFSGTMPAALPMAALGLLGLGLGGNGTIFMKVSLSGLPQQDAAAATGAYTLFRDLAAPFGVAVLVPRFTNQIAALLASGRDASRAATIAVHSLGRIELLLIAAGMAVVCFLPNSRGKEKSA